MGTIKERFSEEKEKVRRLGVKAGAAYIWQYYSLWIVGLTVFLALVLYLVVRFATTPSGFTYYMTLANTRADAGEGSRLWKDYVEFTGYDTSQGRIAFDDESYFDYALDQGRGNTYYNAFVGLVDNGVLDAVTMSTESLTALGRTGRLIDLNREECRSIREKYGDRFLYALPLNTEYSEEPVPIGIDISDSRLVTDYQVYEGDCALGICSESGRIQAAEAFLDFVFSE